MRFLKELKVPPMAIDSRSLSSRHRLPKSPESSYCPEVPRVIMESDSRFDERPTANGELLGVMNT